MKEIIGSSSARLLFLAACLTGIALLTAGAMSTSAAAAGRQRMLLYSLTEQEQFVNNQDDRARGEGHNPFGIYSDVSSAVTKPKAGPFPGDEALFSFNVYKSANLKTRAGSATFTCQYNFSKNAFCDVSFQLINGGTLIAAGAFNFDAATFTLAITGGYGKYVDATGEVVATPSANHAQQLSFQLD